MPDEIIVGLTAAQGNGLACVTCGFDYDGWWPATGERTLFNPAGMKIVYYSYRGGKIPSPWPSTA